MSSACCVRVPTGCLSTAVFLSGRDASRSMHSILDLITWELLELSSEIGDLSSPLFLQPENIGTQRLCTSLVSHYPQHGKLNAKIKNIHLISKQNKFH